MGRPANLTRILTYPWPGNIRELQNILERTTVLAQGSLIEISGHRFRNPACRCIARRNTSDARSEGKRSYSPSAGTSWRKNRWSSRRGQNSWDESQHVAIAHAQVGLVVV